MANEKRLIDANALMEQFNDSFNGFVMKKIIEMQPTVDAVEVVRCKDCKHSRPTQWYSTMLKCCHKSHGNSQVAYEVPQYHFCSYGERREGE